MSQLIFAQRQQVKGAMSTLEDAFNELDTCYTNKCAQLQARVDSLEKIIAKKDSTIERLFKQIEQLTTEFGHVTHKFRFVFCCDFAYFFFF